jgi:uncharacterized protein (TIGR02217 family)
VVASSITVDAIYLDGRVSSVLGNSIWGLEDDTVVKTSDNGLVETNERWDRVKHNWNLSWSTASSFIENLFKVNRQSRGFLFISPRSDDRKTTAQACRNTVTGLGSGDGSTKTFQLQLTDSTTAHSVTHDVNYPLASPNLGVDSAVVMYVAGVAKVLGSDFTFSSTTGIVTFTSAPANAAAITADFSYAWPVRFTSSTISATLLQLDQVEVRSVQIEEIF